MPAEVPDDLQRLVQAIADCEREAASLVAGLDAGDIRRPPAGGWSVAECLDHVAAANRVYLAAMRPSAERARRHGRLRRGPARPGLIGAWFVRTMEPPVTRPMQNPKQIQPRSQPPLADAYGSLLASHVEFRAFLDQVADLDLAHIHFPNPFVRGVRFSLATGVHVIPAHERRHLWQARRVLQTAPAVDGVFSG